MIKLTVRNSKKDDGEPIYINPKYITSLFWLDDEKRTQIVTTPTYLDYVKETPEEIIKLMKGIK